MKRTNKRIAIVGAGISGLIAALNLEKEGYFPEIYEKTFSAGGRVKTDIVDGFQLDHGFQVLLEAYPMAQKYLDYGALELQRFLPGAIIYKGGREITLGDPLRAKALLLPTLLGGVGTLADKVKILALNKALKKKDIDTIFKSDEITTWAYLIKKGFSEEIIEQFFRPFFSGIFLEPNLETSSRMFEFVYKMFGTGYASVPKAGMAEIPKQLASRLERTKIHYNRPVTSCDEGMLYFKNERKKRVDYTIIATEAAPLISNLRNQALPWYTASTLYFSCPEVNNTKPLIGLVPQKDTLINNLFFHTNLETVSKGKGNLLSVTVVQGHNLSEYKLIKRVRTELREHCKIDNLTYLQTYTIKKALPVINGLMGNMQPSETRLTNTIFLAGDYLLNGSLNAAMLTGEMAAKAVLEALREPI